MSDLKLKKSIYSSENVQTAIRAYHALTKIILSESDQDWELMFLDCKVDKNRTMAEFENYLIELENL